MNITMYLGARTGNRDVYRSYAYELGAWIACHGHTLIYGGSRTGLMGKLADGALDHGGRVIGVEPQFFMEEELQHEGLTELIVTRDMASRKKKMMEMGDVFLAFPGGIGTLEEISEVMSQIKLGLLPGRFTFLDFNGYYQPMKALLLHMAHEGFVDDSWARQVAFLSSFEQLDAFLAE
jgi:uncharacterized protein (TIGR00730 family)